MWQWSSIQRIRIRNNVRAMAPNKADMYRTVRERLLDLAGEIGDEEAERQVPACPSWTVREVYAHLAGVAVDALAGRTDGVASDPWTARQVEERAGRSLEENLAEWAEAGGRFDEVIRQFDDAIPPQLIVDVWNHEQDVRGAVGRPGGTDGPEVRWLADAMCQGISDFLGEGGPVGAVRVVTESGERVIGSGDPVATLRTTDVEVVRALIGRRSRRQMLAYDWEGDPEAVVDRLHVFPFPEHDLAI
jgi:uncharacterized protein (TIGR03083 family)